MTVVDGVVRQLGWRYRLSREEQEDFASSVKVRLLENDAAILRKYEGRSSLATFLRVVVTRLWLDERVRAWGRWRPSIEAVRLGPLAVALERLLHHQHLPLDEAIESLCSREPGTDADTLRHLAGKLPNRGPGRRLVDESSLEDLPADGPPADHLVVERAARARSAMVAAALREEVARLPPRAQLLLRLRFEQGTSIADIARTLEEPQKPFYREFERLLHELRLALERRGVAAHEIRDVIVVPPSTPLVTEARPVNPRDTTVSRKCADDDGAVSA